MTLKKDLQEALEVAQDHALKGQHHQANVYNRKVKGSNINTGDRVLLANKGERGRRKLGDRWESVVYTVINKNPQTHTYRIRDTKTGKERVVHRNLLMLANFLPIYTECASEDKDLCEVSSSESVTSRDDSEEPNTDVQELNPVSRTLNWVMETSCSDEHRSLSHSKRSNSESELSGDKEENSIQVQDESGLEDGEELSMHTDFLNSAVATELTNNETHVSPQPAPEIPNILGHVRTRVGRIIKPVNRLLYTMSNQNINKGSNASIQKWAKSVYQNVMG
ncbi:uncharacterized protein LOC135359216 [Latimeria chalumnae]|uniref:uncharacterized protein LOC135359216 n=1 Tax=Latimeria chalumnae TaxID=7897 RepID=UPI00313C3266